VRATRLLQAIFEWGTQQPGVHGWRRREGGIHSFLGDVRMKVKFFCTFLLFGDLLPVLDKGSCWNYLNIWDMVDMGDMRDRVDMGNIHGWLIFGRNCLIFGCLSDKYQVYYVAHNNFFEQWLLAANKTDTYTVLQHVYTSNFTEDTFVQFLSRRPIIGSAGTLFTRTHGHMDTIKGHATMERNIKVVLSKQQMVTAGMDRYYWR